MIGLDPATAGNLCPSCGSGLPPSRLVCPACHRLVHAGRLAGIADDAERATREGRQGEAIAAWRSALDLLPPESTQFRKVAEKLRVLAASEHAVTDTSSDSTRRWASGAGLLGTLGLLAWKLKFALVFALTKAKLLLSGFAKAGTLLSMVASLGVYWAAWGWHFAAGFVLSIYVHEMGHVAALRRLGIPASAPMFIPGFGALVRMKQLPASPHEEARVGLAGPIWGLGAALACAAAFYATGAPFWAAIAQWGARINLFNLIPVRPLDGGRGMAPLARGEAGLVTAAIAASLVFTGEGMLWVLLLVAAARVLGKGAAGPGDRRATVEYTVLVVALSALAVLPVAVPAP